MSPEQGLSNSDVPWDSFDSDAYFESNYRWLLREDAEIIGIVADHFRRWAPRPGRAGAIDVGTGTNLYPALTMLPFAERVTLFERSLSNRAWLTNQLREPAESWEPFWAEMRGRPEYDRIAGPLDRLASCSQVVKGNLFDLAPRGYDIGTMFFVAEGITTRTEEFERAVRVFMASLTAGAPFAAAFMRDSWGYEVGCQRFPACPINEDDVQRCLAEVARIDAITVVDSRGLREGYSGMIVATGLVAG
ncbi:hypothetical protein JIG36_46990 [Actinoplanes sp. LDG1-06]|uniref:NNMT/PNMT/TEMT family protein n=1 Tax=Paractinoplanes ovalisporus TaxID=2810368 RepID=A0ABS2AT76_9ACTN|nr:SCO2525 family SAM-dependent methyltransferase [Actinoplanes ovalisporus]MBM2623072.1 hypothetical protein [Actinoplanes ovalisporus]